MLPILERTLIDKLKWTTKDEMMDYYAIGQCTPGIIAVNTATFVGQKTRGVAGGIADCENRVYCCGGYHSHSHYLGDSRSASCDGILQVLPVKGKKELSCLGDADLKEYLISADGAEEE